MNIKIRDKEYKLKLSMRAYMLMENIQGRSFDIQNMTDTITFFYCIILTSSKEYDFKYDELLDMLDEDPKLLVEFNSWLLGEYQKENMLSPESPEDDSKKKENQ